MKYAEGVTRYWVEDPTEAFPTATHVLRPTTDGRHVRIYRVWEHDTGHTWPQVQFADGHTASVAWSDLVALPAKTEGATQ